MNILLRTAYALALVAIPAAKAGCAPSWEYVKLCLKILLEAQGYRCFFI